MTGGERAPNRVTKGAFRAAKSMGSLSWVEFSVSEGGHAPELSCPLLLKASHPRRQVRRIEAVRAVELQSLQWLHCTAQGAWLAGTSVGAAR